MIEPVESGNEKEYDAFVLSSPYGHFMQSREWGRLKSDWTWEAFMLRGDGGEIKGSLALLFRKAPGLPYCLAYGCRGPVCDPADADTASTLLNHAVKVAAKRGAYLIKLDPGVVDIDCPLIKTASDVGYKFAKETKGFETVQPRFVFRLDIKSKTPDEILSGFHQKWRYNIRLAERKGVIVSIESSDALDEFSRLMTETGLRDGFVTRDRRYFEKMLAELGSYARLYMAKLDGEYVSGAIAIQYGNKTWYLYGASDTAHRNSMSTYLLQWNMIQWALESGCDLYDFRGVSGDLSEDNPLYGLYRFKKGFGGDLTEFAGELDYTIKPLVNWALTKGRRLYAVSRTKRFLKKR